MERRSLLGVIALGLVGVPVVIDAQHAARVWRIGFVSPGFASLTVSRLAALQQGLRELGYARGQNLVIEERYADGHFERVADLAAELVRLKVDALVVHGTGALGAKKATATIPIVFIANPDP